MHSIHLPDSLKAGFSHYREIAISGYATATILLVAAVAGAIFGSLSLFPVIGLALSGLAISAIPTVVILRNRPDPLISVCCDSLDPAKRIKMHRSEWDFFITHFYPDLFRMNAENWKLFLSSKQYPEEDFFLKAALFLSTGPELQSIFRDIQDPEFQNILSRLTPEEQTEIFAKLT